MSGNIMFKAPTNCPSCDSTLVWRNEIIYCDNNKCPAKLNKSVEHFAKTLKIKGLGPATIQKLGLTSVSEIYTMDIVSMMSSEKTALKLMEEIKNSQKHKMNKLLPALGIPLIGNTASEKLSKVCLTILDINEDTCAKAGLGPKATENLLDWLIFNLDWVLKLPFDFTFETITGAEIKGVVCITGKLVSYKTKADAAKDLEQSGWKVVSNITKEVTHLVNESMKPTAKTQKAEASGVIIVNNVKEILGDN